MIDVYPVENAQAELEKINALVNLLQEMAEHASSDKGVYQSTFEGLSMNLLIVFDLIYNLRADLTKAINDAYHKKTEG